MGIANPRPWHLQHCLEADLPESSFAQIDLGVLVAQVEQEPAACPCSKDGQQHPGLYLRRLRQVILPLHPALLGHIWGAGLSMALNWVLQRATTMTEGLKHLSHKDRLRELGLFRPEKKRLRDQANQYALNTWPSNCPSLKIDSSQYHHQYHPDNLLQTYKCRYSHGKLTRSFHSLYNDIQLAACVFLHGNEIKELEKWKHLLAKQICYAQIQLSFLYPKLHLCCPEENFGREILPTHLLS